ATLYGVGARLDEKPEFLFVLRNANHLDLIASAATAESLKHAADSERSTLKGSNLTALFGIELEQTDSPQKEATTSKTIRPKPKKITKKRKSGLKTKMRRTKKRRRKT
ncbi:MAG: hypothetical protein HY537_13660, partial [Deltaproteobacteria bacterium]|nr:hypothetical protein [Deltaproteobacteria bacterium]